MVDIPRQFTVSLYALPLCERQLPQRQILNARYKLLFLIWYKLEFTWEKH